MERISSFREHVAECIKRAHENFGADEEIVRLRDYFNGLSGKVDMREFSENAVALARHPQCTKRDRDLLTEHITTRPGAMHPFELEKYLRITSNEEVARCFVDAFFSHIPPVPCQTALSFNDPIVWKIKQAFNTIRAMAPELLPDFCTVVLDFFPGLPPGETNAGLQGLLRHNARPSKENGEIRHVFSSSSLRLVPLGGKGGQRAKSAVA